MMIKIQIMSVSSESTKKPSPKAVVELLSLKVREDKTTAQRNGATKETATLVFKCPNINCNQPNSETKFAAKTGHANGLAIQNHASRVGVNRLCAKSVTTI